MARRYCIMAALAVLFLACLSSIFVSASISDASVSDDAAQTLSNSTQGGEVTPTVVLEDALYDAGTSLLTFRGISSESLVNVVVRAGSIESCIDSCEVIDGRFQDVMLVEHLPENGIVLWAYAGESVDSMDVTTSKPLTVDAVSYDAGSGILSFEGKAPSGIVNIRVTGGGYASAIDACPVQGGFYSDSIYLGRLDSGEYNLIATSGSLVANETFEVTDSRITIDQASYDPQSGVLDYSGSADTELVYVVIRGNGFISQIDACKVRNGSYSGSMYVGELDNGLYFLVASFGGNVVEKSLEIDGSSSGIPGLVLSRDGTVLERYTDTVDVFRIPDGVSEVADGAFDNCKIKEFVLDRDLIWRITISNGKYPFENAGLESIKIGDGVSKIPDYLFAKTGITEITIPSSVGYIGIKAFYCCNNLSSVQVSDDSQLCSVGEYSFSSNKQLEKVTFGSSASGIYCNILRGAFINDGSLVNVTMKTGFNVVSIGDFAFTKVLNSGVTAPGVNVNSEAGIMMPKSVCTIGTSAFSYVDSLDGSAEPMKNTYLYDFPYIGSVTVRIVMDGAAVISFEEGSNLTTIGSYAFAGYGNVPGTNINEEGISKVDLSACSKLKEIGDSSFRRSLKPTAEIIFSDSVESIGAYAFYHNRPRSEQNITAIIPSSVMTVGKNALWYASKIIFEEGSQLRTIEDQTTPDWVDLTNCLELESDKASGRNTLLPPGVYDRGNFWSSNVDQSTPIALLIDGQKLVIEESTVAIAKQSLKSVVGIECDSNNKYFFLQNNILYFTNNGEIKVVLILGESDTVCIKDNITIGSGAIPDGIKELIVEGDVNFSDDVFDSSVSIESFVFGKVLDNPSWRASDIFWRMTSDVCYHIMAGSSSSCIEQFDSLGRLFIGYTDSDGNVIFLPYSIDGIQIGYDAYSEGNVLKIRVDDGVFQYYDAVGIGCSITIESNVLTVQAVDGKYSKVVLTSKSSDIIDNCFVKFDGSGGYCNGSEFITRTVFSGKTLADIDIPSFTRPDYRFVGWYLDDVMLDESYQIRSDIVLKAVWEQRNPIIVFEEDAATIDCNGLASGSEIEKGEYTFKLSEINPGYEVLYWVVNGQMKGDANKELKISIDSDTVISVSYRYYAPSSGLNPISNRDLPSPDEITSLVQAYTLGGYLDKNSGAVWKGHASVPLIVDDRVFFRAGPYLYVAESDTGYIINCVNSIEANQFYHHLGYGDGIVVDCLTGKAYNLDLEQCYSIASKGTDGKEVQLTGVEYNDGWFYTSGSNIYRFESADEDPATNEVKKLEFVGEITGSYSSYGFTSSIFVDNYLYRVVTDGIFRGVAGIDLKTGKVGQMFMPSLNSMYLDDGWITYHEGYLYLTAYSQGLFGAVATLHNSRMAYVPVNGLVFGSEGYYEFEDGGFASQFVVVDGIGYVNCSKKLYMFDMSEPGNPKLIGTGDSSFGHGSIAIDTSDIDMDGSPVYIYMIPYDSNVSFSFCLVEAIGDGSDRKLIRHTVSYLPKNYNSQTVRADIDGRMIWYNDSGHIFTYTTEEKNPFFFFIEKDGNAMWYESYGKTAADALSRLGRDVVTLDDSRGISTLFGHPAESSKIWVLESKASQTQIANLKKYGWTEIPNLYDSAYDVYHYYVIRADGSAGFFEEGTEFSFYAGDEVRSYKFRMNIGEDRSAIGIQMVLGKDLSKIKIYDDSGQLAGEYTGRIGTEINASFPDYVNPGKVAQWMLSGTAVAELRGQVFVSGGSEYRLTWVDEPVKFDIGSSIVDNGETVSISYTLNGRESGVDMVLGIYVICSDGSILNRVVDIDEVSTTGAFEFETAGVDSYYLKVYMKGQNGAVIEDFGHYLYKAEAAT